MRAGSCAIGALVWSGFLASGACGFEAGAKVHVSGGMPGQCDWPDVPLADPCGLAVPDEELMLDGDGRYLFLSDELTLFFYPRGPGPATNIPVEAGVISQPIEVAAITATSITIGPESELRLEGSRPVAILSWSTVVIDGEVDANSRSPFSGDGAAAGSDTGGCAAPSPGPVGQSAGGPGGGGGGFGSHGGMGGGVTDSGSEVLPSTMGGGGADLGDVLRGGCPGAAGGTSEVGTPASGGAGGGGFLIAAMSSISIGSEAEVHAGGAGGQRGQVRDGGGGGGSGGVVALWAPSVTLGAGAVLAANGGGGGEGGTQFNVGTSGQPGRADDSAASGGSGGAGSGNGGDGGFVGELDGQDGDANEWSGGGGGGGVGFTAIGGTLDDQGAIFSPPATVLD